MSNVIQPGNVSCFALDTTKGFTTLKLEDKNTTSLHVTWNHPYPECKQFTVYVNTMELANVSSTSHTITDLTPGTEYNVTVVAMEGPLPNQFISEVLMTEPGT